MSISTTILPDPLPIVDEDHDIVDPEVISIDVIILVITIIVSFCTVLLTFFAVHFIKTRIVNKIKFLNSLISRGERRLNIQVYDEQFIADLANQIDAKLDIMRDERIIFGRQMRGEVEQQGDIRAGRGLTTKETEFKMPANAYDEASFNDKEYSTLYISKPTNTEEVFPNRNA